MKVLRNDNEVFLQELLKQLLHTTFQYDAAVEWLKRESHKKKFQSIVRKRRELIQSIEDGIKNHGDLPAGPDLDSEEFKMIGNMAMKEFSQNAENEIVAQRLADDEAIKDYLTGQAKEEFELDSNSLQISDNTLVAIDEALLVLETF